MMNKIIFENFTQELKTNICNNYNSLEHLLENEYGLLALDAIRLEICKCIICGFNQAAMALTNHLLESALKKALIIYDSMTNKVEPVDITSVFDAPTQKYAQKNLSSNIISACHKGLITKDEAERLDGFREKYRNAFSHADPQKLFNGISVPVNIVKVNTDDCIDDLLSKIYEPPRIHLPVENHVIIQGLVQNLLADQQSLDYFLELDNIIRKMCKRLINHTTSNH